MSIPHAPAGRRDPEAFRSTDGFAQEVFFIRSGADRIYGTCFSSPSPRDVPGVVVCSSWGFESYRLRDGCHTLARRVAQRGGAAIVFDWVGHGDSSGEPEEATPQRLVEVAADVIEHGRRLVPALDWGFAGFRVGACVAAIAAVETGASSQLLIQPSLDPAAHFAEITKAMRRATLGQAGGDQLWAFGSPLPDLATWDVGALDAAGALRSFAGRSAVVRFSQPATAGPPDNVEEVVVDGAWRTGLTGAARRDLVPL
ncbi:MAG: hypothetical protein ACRDKS_00180, partial [Actinomycetota bacterium]